MCNILEVNINRELEKCNFHFYFFNWIVSVRKEGKIMKIAGDVDEIYLEGTVSQISFLGPSFYFMKSRKLS